MEGGELSGGSRSALYVLESFDTAEYRTLVGKHRWVDPQVLLNGSEGRRRGGEGCHSVEALI